MQDAEKQFAKTRSEADKLKLETAQADYDNMVRNLKSVTQACLLYTSDAADDV